MYLSLVLTLLVLVAEARAYPPIIRLGPAQIFLLVRGTALEPPGISSAALTLTQNCSP